MRMGLIWGYARFCPLVLGTRTTFTSGCVYNKYYPIDETSNCRKALGSDLDYGYEILILLIARRIQTHQQNGKSLGCLGSLRSLGRLEILHSIPVTHPDTHILGDFQT
ncbi:hypothetical protein BD779DRAFT_1585245 [Infundibulicybe gibba]|nr:hypothetical protein BD779DRAFT_1585245 [Infundibulicybe gibba]